MLNPTTGAPHTAHTTNPVPFIITGDKGQFDVTGDDGCLADVAPTCLAIMGLPQPEEMTGKSLVKNA
jgi:2,3-bisphosphoglycerate-independent phosphoglycerate mutase